MSLIEIIKKKDSRIKTITTRLGEKHGLRRCHQNIGLLAVCLSPLFYLTVYAGHPIDPVADKMSQEYVGCYSYYAITAEAMQKSGEPQLALELRALAQAASDSAIETAKEGRSSAAAEQVTITRIEAMIDDMTDEIEGDISNIGILSSRYGKRCKVLMSHPEMIYKQIAP